MGPAWLGCLVALCGVGAVQAVEPPPPPLEKQGVFEHIATSRSPQSIAPGKFAFCCSACLDVSVNATMFVRHVIEHFGLTDHEFRPRFHAVLGSVEDFVESFLFFFERGSGTEQRMLDPELFEKIATIARQEVGMTVYPGGNAITMAKRVALEGAGHVVLGAQVSAEMKLDFPGNTDFVSPNSNSPPDVHLTLEYQTGDSIEGVKNVTSARMNRYYVNADVHNARLTSAKVFHDYIKSQPSSADYMVTIAGFQLLDPAHLEGEAGQQLDEMARALHRHQGESHFESGAFEDAVILDAVWSRGILHNVTSIGLNEQELAMLDWKLHSSGSPTPHGSEAKPALEETVVTLRKVLRTLNHKGSLSRMHFHTLHFHAVCYDPAIWLRGDASVASGSAVASDLSCGDAFATHNLDAFDVRYRNVVKCDAEKAAPKEIGLEVIECCVAPVLVCKKPVRMAGLGDSISGTGLRYHALLAKIAKPLEEL